MAVCHTKYLEDFLDEKTSDNLYRTLYESIKWEDGIKSKKTKPLGLEDDQAQLLLPYIFEAIHKLKPDWVKGYNILGIYLNLYEDGNEATPNHTHPKQHQIVISLGAERMLKVGSKSFSMKNGSSIIFGGSIHGALKQQEVKQGKISIATFMLPVA